MTGTAIPLPDGWRLGLPHPERSLRILQLSTNDQGGGAERIAWTLFTTYRQRGHDAWLVVGGKRTSHPYVLPIPRDPIPDSCAWRFARINDRLASWDGHIAGIAGLRRVVRTLERIEGALSYRLGIEDFDFPGSRAILSLLPKRPDIIHAHNLHGGYFDLRQLAHLSRQVPMVLTLHDAWLLSGHCAHSFDCDRWRTGCGRCPDIDIYPAIRRDATAFNWRRKRAIYAQSRLYVTTPCQWLLNRVEESILAPAVIRGKVIPNGVDTKIFCPGDKGHARDRLGFPHDIPILLFAANGIKRNCFKDYVTLHRAIETLGFSISQEFWLVVLGEDGEDERIGKALIHFVAKRSNPQTIADHYRAADIYLHAARAETFPNTVLEAMACGIPVIASRVGGIPDQIEEGINGILVPPSDPKVLAQAVTTLLFDSQRRAGMGQAAAVSAQQRFSLDQQVTSYLDWYEEILEINVA